MLKNNNEIIELRSEVERLGGMITKLNKELLNLQSNIPTPQVLRSTIDASIRKIPLLSSSYFDSLSRYQNALETTYSGGVINLGTTDDAGVWSSVSAVNAVVTATNLLAGSYRVWFQFPWHTKFQDGVLGKYVGCLFSIYDGTSRHGVNEVRWLSMAGSWNEETILPISIEGIFTYTSPQASVSWLLQKIAVVDAATVDKHEVLSDGTNNRCLTKGYQWT